MEERDETDERVFGERPRMGNKGEKEEKESRSREIWGWIYRYKGTNCDEQGMPDHPLAASFRMQARRLISY